MKVRKRKHESVKLKSRFCFVKIKKLENREREIVGLAFHRPFVYLEIKQLNTFTLYLTDTIYVFQIQFLCAGSIQKALYRWFFQMFYKTYMQCSSLCQQSKAISMNIVPTHSLPVV